MTKLGAAISESVLYHYGSSELLSRLSDPFWFQALGCVMGMDWHSSGITTSVMGALKRGLNPRAHELGINRADQKRQTREFFVHSVHPVHYVHNPIAQNL